MQWLYNASTPDLMNPFKSLHSAGNGAFHVGKDHHWQQSAPVPFWEFSWLQLNCDWYRMTLFSRPTVRRKVHNHLEEEHC